MATFANLGTGNSNVNPATSMTMVSSAAINPGDKVFLAVLIPNSNPTGLVVTFDGQAMTQDGTSFRSSPGTIFLFRYDDVAGRATGKTFSVAWTNSGTSSAGGAVMTAFKSDGLAAGGPDTTNGTGNGLNATPTTNASGTPASSSAKYVAVAILGSSGITAAGQTSPNNAYTGMAESFNSTRQLAVVGALKEFTAPPVAAQTETWTVTWGASKAWDSVLAMYPEPVVGAPTNTTAPVVSGTNNVGDTLTTTDGAWTGSPTGFAYDWQRDVGTGGVTWVSIDSNQPITTVAGSPSVTVSSIVPLITGMPVFGPGIPAGTVISEIQNATTVVLSANATASATVTAYFGTNNTNSYVITADDLGCQIRCRVTAINASGNSAPASSNSTTAVPVPSFPTVRLVVAPIAQSDNQTHSSTLRLPVLAGETLVYLGGCSVSNVGGDIGAVTDDAGDTWTLRQDASILDSTHGGGTQAFSTVCAAGMAYGASVTTLIKQTTVVGANALNSAVINVVSTAGFDTAGSIVINGVAVTYTGITPTSLTGCGSHAAYVGGESVHYHGQSPYWMVVAINPGAGRTCSYDNGVTNTQTGVTSFTTGTALASGSTSVALTIFRRGTPDVFTPAAGWTKIHDGPFANAGNPYTGESSYCATALAQIITGSGNVTATGTVPDFQDNGNVLALFSISGGTTNIAKTGGGVSAIISGITKLASVSKIAGAISPGLTGTFKLTQYVKTSGGLSSGLTGGIRTTRLLKSAGGISTGIIGGTKRFISMKTAGGASSSITGALKNITFKKTSGSITNSVAGGSYTFSLGTVFFVKIGGALSAGIAGTDKSLTLQKIGGTTSILIVGGSHTLPIYISKTGGGITGSTIIIYINTGVAPSDKHYALNASLDRANLTMATENIPTGIADVVDTPILKKVRIR